MAALDFPNAPTIGQVWPTPPVAGVPVYRWDGEKWGMQSAALDVIPSGTKMLFYQAAAPAGWVQDTTHNDKALRVVSGAGGGAGGSNPFSTVMAQTVVGNHTLTLAETPGGITTGGSNLIVVYPSGNPLYTLENFYASGTYTSYQIAAGASGVWVIAGTSSGNVGIGAPYTNMNITGASTNTGGGAHNHPITMQMQYVDMIIASRA